MEKIYELYGYRVPVTFKEGVIQIKGSEELQQFLSADIDSRSEVLATLIKSDYLLRTSKALAISEESLMVEIWGHVYASQMAEAIKSLTHLKLIEQMADFVMHRADTIDCGEREKDSNRLFWDLLANFKSIILSFLPNKH